MADSNTKYYHFAWNGDSEPAQVPPPISAKDRVAKILSETELDTVPDLVFRSPLAEEKRSFLGGFRSSSSAAAAAHNDKRTSLRGEHELFSIDDDDWMFDGGEVNTEDGLDSSSSKQTVANASSSRTNRPIYKPPASAAAVISHDPRTRAHHDAQFTTYFDDGVEAAAAAAAAASAPASSQQQPAKDKQHQSKLPQVPRAQNNVSCNLTRKRLMFCWVQHQIP